MSSQLKITADTSEIKKSILDIGKSFKELKGSKVQIFSNEDKKFIKEEMKKEMALLKNKIKENRDEIKKMVEVQDQLVKGSDAELENRKKILEAYKVQAKLGKQLGQVQGGAKLGGDIDKGGGGGGGLLSSLMGFARMIPGLAAVATVGYAVSKGMQANDQYVSGVGNRNRLKGLGVMDENFGKPQDLARVGLSEQDMIQRRIEATAILGRQGTSNQTEMQKAAFERAYGLQGGTMTGIAGQLRGTMGGAGANEAQMKLQASIMAAGLEDALGPYLESAVQLLSNINENGATNTTEMTNLLARLTKEGTRTPEMLAKTFSGINAAVKGATGEKSAFLQTAFARAGIGGGTLGGTKYALESGGIMGLDKDALAKRGYNPALLENMEKTGMFSGVGQRTSAIMDMFKKSGGLKAGENISGIQDPTRMIGMGNLANSVFGTKGDQGFDALMMLEKVQKGEMSQKQFDQKLKDLKEKDPVTERLDKINNTLSGISEILRTTRGNVLENLGKEAVIAGNEIVRNDTQGIQGISNVAGAINQTGVVQKTGKATAGFMENLNSGAIGDKIYDWWKGDDEKKKLADITSDESIIKLAKAKRDRGEGFQGWSDEKIEQRIKETTSKALTAKDIGKEVANALKDAPITNKTTIQLPDGKVQERLNK